MKSLSIALFAFTAFMFAACNSEAQQAKPTVAANKVTIEVFQLHSEHRCVTCAGVRFKLTGLYYLNIYLKVI